MPSRLFYLSSLDESISIIRDVHLVFLSPCFICIPVLNANSVDPDQIWVYTVCQCPIYGMLCVNGLTKTCAHTFINN